jgi:hypothetical protein
MPEPAPVTSATRFARDAVMVFSLLFEKPRCGSSQFLGQVLKQAFL